MYVYYQILTAFNKLKIIILDIRIVLKRNLMFLQMYLFTQYFYKCICTWLKVSMKLFCYKSPFQQNLSLIIFLHTLDN